VVRSDVSIPQSGFGAFGPDDGRQTTDDRPQATGHGRPTAGDRPRTTDRRRPATDDRPQATGHGRPTAGDRPRMTDDPRSGLGGFELSSVVCGQWSGLTFQSLSRDSGRLNDDASPRHRSSSRVSIPQSGFGAFGPDDGRQTTDDRPQATGHGRPTTDDRPRTTDDPRSGLGGFELSSVVCGQWSGLTFQSLSRDSGHLDQTTDDRPRTTDRRRPATDDRPQATGHGRPDRPRTTDRRRPTTDDG
jgi:hypothetical protein